MGSTLKAESCVLNTDSLRRYARHIVLPDIGDTGQQKLLASSVLVVGAGGLGSSAIAYLAASGIGRIGIIEPDRVELSNLQRQLLFETGDQGRPKGEAARDRVEELNPNVHVDIYPTRIDATNAVSLIEQYDIVIDGSDNFATRFVLAESCLRTKKTLVSAAISGFQAQISTFKPHEGGPCYRCLVTDMPERELSCAQEGIVGPLAGVMGSMQALETIKELLGIGESLSGFILSYDALMQQWRKITLTRDPHCPLCA